MLKSRQEWEKELHKKIFENRRPVDFRLHEVYDLWRSASSAKIGTFKRKAKGIEYVSPRILLPHYFKKHVGRECYVLEGKASIGNWPFLQNVDIIILAIRTKG